MATLKAAPGDAGRVDRDGKPPLVLHVVYRFDVGGLENGVVNLINHMPAGAYRHAVLALTEVTDFRRRIRREGVQTFALNKPPGHGVWQYRKLYRLFRDLQPAVVHTRNLACLEAVVPAWAAGVPVRVHGEHGREGRDLGQGVTRYDRIRRLYRPFVSHHIALSQDLARYLSSTVKVSPACLSQIYNGVDTDKFTPSRTGRGAILGCPFDHRHWVVGTVGRMQEVKDQPMLARAFVRALEIAPGLGNSLRLVMIGDGPLRTQVMDILGSRGMLDLCWMPGARDDVADILRGLDCFVLPSLSEGISNVVLEAMASGLPVVATAVGGNPELVRHGESGCLVPPADPHALAETLVALAGDPRRARALGDAGRADVEARFSMRAMVSSYQALYDRLLRRDSVH